MQKNANRIFNNIDSLEVNGGVVTDENDIKSEILSFYQSFTQKRRLGGLIFTTKIAPK